jgi:integrase
MSNRDGSARRAYGTGSLREEPRTAGRSVWVARWRPSSDARQLERVVGPKRTTADPDGLTRKQAEAEFRRLIEETDATPAARGPRMTLDALAADYQAFLRHKKRKKSTLVAVESGVRVHLAPTFDGRTIDAITFDDVTDLVAALEKRGLSAKSVRNYVGTLSAMLAWAAMAPRFWIPRNPCVGVELPGMANRDEIRFLDEAECDAIVRHVEKGDYAAIDRAFYVTAFGAGLRHGELCALRIMDVDWVAGRIRVRRNWVLGEDGTPKSRRSSRSVPMTDRVAGELDRLVKPRGKVAPDALVFPDPHTGGPMDKAKTLRRFRRTLRAAGVDDTHTLHDLRHTFGTRMAAGGVPMRTLQEWMGHRQISTTERYADYAPSIHERNLIEAASAPASASPLNLPSMSPDLSESQGT